MRAIERVRGLVEREIFDYDTLMFALRDYKKPRDAITRMLQEGSIIRVKKGLYVFGPAWRRGPLYLEPLANLIYGPSYISLEYALSFYNLIPERVYTISSMTTSQKKIVYTPLGPFEYVHLPVDKYAVGVTYVMFGNQFPAAIATPEKALCDRLSQIKHIVTTEELLEYIVSGLRIDESNLKNLNTDLCQEISAVYQHKTIDTLVKLKDML